MRSSPGNSLPNLTQCTRRAPGFISPYCKVGEIPSFILPFQAGPGKLRISWPSAATCNRIAPRGWGQTRLDLTGSHPQQCAREELYRCVINFVSLRVLGNLLVLPEDQRKDQRS